MTPDLAPESHPFLPTKRVFHIRPTVEEDAPAILSIEEHISKYSPTATRNQTASLAEFEDRIISLQSVPQAVHSIAKFGRRASDHAVEYVVESTEAGHHQTSGSDLPRGALGYTVVVPWQACYMVVSTEEKLLTFDSPMEAQLETATCTLPV